MSTKKEEIIELLRHNLTLTASGGLNIEEIAERLAARENGASRRGYIKGGIVAFFISGLLMFQYFRANEPTALHTLPDRPAIIIDTSRDSSYLNYRQGSPEANQVFDSSVKAAPTADDNMARLLRYMGVMARTRALEDSEKQVYIDYAQGLNGRTYDDYIRAKNVYNRYWSKVYEPLRDSIYPK